MSAIGKTGKIGPLDSLARLGGAAVGADYCFLTRRERDVIRFIGRASTATDVGEFWQVPMADSLCGWVMTHEERLTVSDLHGDARFLEVARSFGVRAYLGTPVRDECGEVIGTACLMTTEIREWSDRDHDAVTDLARQARGALLHRQLGVALDNAFADRFGLEILAEFVANSELGMHSLDGEGRILWANPQAAKLVGRSLEDYVGRNVTEFHVQPEAFGPVMERIKRGEYVRNLHYSVVHADGSQRHVSCNSNGYFEGGEFVHTRCCLRDVTAIVESAQMLKERERQFRRLADHVPALIWEADARNERTFFNRSWLEFTGRSSDDECGAGWLAGIHRDDVSGCNDIFARSVAARSEFAIEFRLRDRDGTYRWVRDCGQPRFDENGEFDGFIGCALDVTEIHDAQQERLTVERRLGEAQKLESLALLAGGVAHDFNNLLTSMLGNCGLLRDASEPADNEELLVGIEQAALRARDLCRRMLAYSGRGRFSVSEVDLSTIVRDHQSVLPMCAGPPVSLSYRLEEALPAIHADSSQLGQVLLNLVTNAAEASSAGSSVRVATERCTLSAEDLRESLRAPDTVPGDFVVLEVADSGAGMDAAAIARMFDPFFSSKGAGRGLGLSATLGIVRGHRGAIRVVSEPGRGCRVQVFLPVENAARQVFVVPPAPKTRQVVLVVDDEDGVRGVIQRTLEQAGYEVVSAGDGASALASFSRSPGRFGCVVLDYTMPGMSGSKVASAIRDLQPDLPILMMSGYDPAEIESRRSVCVDAFLGKPFTPSELRRVVEGLTDGGVTPEVV